MSWFPTKNKASTGTPRWKTPEGSKGALNRRLEPHGRAGEGQQGALGPWVVWGNRIHGKEESRNYTGSLMDVGL